jgi:hypothetical protein
MVQYGVLRQLLIRHRSFEKLDFLQSNHHLMSAGDFQILFNKWDMKVMQLMLALEKYGVISFVMEALSYVRSPVYGYFVLRHTAGFSNFMRIKWPMEATCFKPAGTLTFYLR